MIHQRMWTSSSTGKKRVIRLYNVWRNMKHRCLNPDAIRWDNYGGRGISICKEWFDFANFRAWAVQNGYKKGLTIDRQNNDGNYESENCHWATRAEQNHNKTHTNTGELNGRAKITAEDVLKIRSSNKLNRYLADIYGLTPSSIAGIKCRRTWRHLN